MKKKKGELLTELTLCEVEVIFISCTVFTENLSLWLLLLHLSQEMW